MMGQVVLEPSLEILTVRSAVAFLKLLLRQFEDIALERYASGARECPCQKGGETAQRITQLCGKLSEELRRYERYERICEGIDAENEEIP